MERSVDCGRVVVLREMADGWEVGRVVDTLQDLSLASGPQTGEDGEIGKIPYLRYLDR